MKTMVDTSAERELLGRLDQDQAQIIKALQNPSDNTRNAEMPTR